MPDDDEVIELRALQARAYGRGGGLTASDAARLDQLVQRRAERDAKGAADGIPAVEPMIPEATDAVARPLHDLRQNAEPTAAAATAETVDSGAHGARTASFPVLLRERWRPMLIGVAVVLGIGIGLGGVLFGRGGAEAVALTPAQQEWQREIMGEATYDQGSLRAVAVEAGVVLWIATKKDGSLTCLVLGDGAHTTSECDTSTVVRDSGLYGTLMVERGEGQTEVTAQMILTAAGEPAVVSDSYEYDPEAMTSSYANDEEARFAETLVAQGFDARTVWVVGYDDEIPIWTAVRTEESTQCLIYGMTAGVADIRCADPAAGEGLWVEHVDAATAQSTRVEWQFTSNHGTNLVITREGAFEHGVVEE
ncbi:hypothetical protein [Microbacterium saperdae]|uniref:Uncharacterized protein n=1 Tax=Microbacterium saperdae TaxID=69368 RepID=A0A543BQN7_9MICO|nr:hypothetical protein [Microbacterium saperdae]TQL87108.1 hypothetical protein FB560_2775 [Microbacterium saperdae]GGM42840.1 hypothetical protein GCM10010489_12410 [Microbacterium saperdae]